MSEKLHIYTCKRILRLRFIFCTSGSDFGTSDSDLHTSDSDSVPRNQIFMPSIQIIPAPQMQTNASDSDPLLRFQSNLQFRFRDSDSNPPQVSDPLFRFHASDSDQPLRFRSTPQIQIDPRFRSTLRSRSTPQIQIPCLRQSFLFTSETYLLPKHMINALNE